MTAVDTPAPRLQTDTTAAVPAAAATPEPSGRAVKSTGARLLLYVVLAIITLAFVYPFVWLVSASFKPRSQVFDN